jgi:histidyl-tRNA synthetase
MIEESQNHMPKKKSSTKKPQSLSELKDILPDTNYSWDLISRRMENLARSFGFLRVETPLLEDAVNQEQNAAQGYGLHGQASEIRFQDPDGAMVALRSRALPAVLRAYAEHSWPEEHTISKWHYLSPALVFDEYAKKYAETWEYGFEVIGVFNPLIQAQLITLVVKFLQSVGIAQAQLEINSIGTVESRKEYEGLLSAYLKTRKYDLCNDCAASIESDPMEIFRCRNHDCVAIAAEAPNGIDYLNEVSRKELTDVLEALDEIGIVYSLNPLFAGQSGASGLVFQVKVADENREYILGNGAGHSKIMETMTDKKISCFGFGGTIEAIRGAMQALQMEIHHQEIKSDVYLVPLGDLASKKALRLFSELWDADITVHDHFGMLGVKNQLKAAEAAKASIALIIGQKEAMDEMVILRDVKSGMQEVFQYERIIDEVKKRLGK